MAIIDELQPIGLLSKEGRYDDCIRELQQLWSRIPHPKEQDGNTFLILIYITSILLKQKRPEDTIEGALKGLLFNGTRNLAGEGEILLGKCEYEAGRIELATDKFCVARTKGGKRIFAAEPKEYFELTTKTNC